MARAPAAVTSTPRRLRGLPVAAVSALAAMAALWALIECLGPRGFAIRDEATCVDLAQRFVTSRVWGPAWSRGSFLRWIQYHLMDAGHSWRWLHAPVLAAFALQCWCLQRLARRFGSPLAAQGAVLAACLSAAALVQSRSILPFAVTPALLLLSVELAFQGPRRALLGGALLAVAVAEYEGALLGLPGVAALLLTEPRLARGRWKWVALGALLCFPFIFLLTLQNWQDWLMWRLRHNAPGADTGESSPFVLRLWQWLTGSEPNPYLGVWHHSSYAAWALPLVALGLATQWRKRVWLGVWIAGGLAGLLPAAFVFEPHRTIAAVPALSLAAGLGWAWAWSRSKRWPWLAPLLVLLPIVGLAWELNAFDRSMREGGYDYASSEAWLRARDGMEVRPPLQAGLLPVGRAWEAIWGPGAAGLPLAVWVPVDLAADGPGWPAQALLDRKGERTGDLLLQAPAGHPLLDELTQLRAFWDRLPDPQGPAAKACREALQSGRFKLPLTRAALWSQLLHYGLLSHQLQVADLAALRAEHFKSVLLYRDAQVFVFEPRLRYWLAWLQRDGLGEKSLNANEKSILSQPWDSLPPQPGSPPWPEPPGLTPGGPPL